MPEIWAHISSYIQYPDVLAVRQVNYLLYELITGDSRIGLVGMQHQLKSAGN
jgi:hypothetical protein